MRPVIAAALLSIDRDVLAYVAHAGLVSVADVIQAFAPGVPEHVVRDSMHRLAMAQGIGAVRGLWFAEAP